MCLYVHAVYMRIEWVFAPNLKSQFRSMQLSCQRTGMKHCRFESHPKVAHFFSEKLCHFCVLHVHCYMYNYTYSIFEISVFMYSLESCPRNLEPNIYKVAHFFFEKVPPLWTTLLHCTCIIMCISEISLCSCILLSHVREIWNQTYPR